MKLLLMADNVVGEAIARWLIENYCPDLAFVVTVEQNAIYARAKEAGIQCVACDSMEFTSDYLVKENIWPDLGVLAWWPKLIKPEIIKYPRYGVINTHPSLLPYNRGKHYNFWALVEQSPFGVSLHFVDDGIDTGDVVAQQSIAYDWEDNGGSLYQKAIKATIELFKKEYPQIRKCEFKPRPQDNAISSFHRAEELEPASLIDLNATYKGRDLLNLLRARTFAGYPACRFEDGGEVYEVRIEIKRRKL